MSANATTHGRSPGQTEGGRWLAEVVVLPKEGVNDPQGEAIRGGLAMLGYDAVRRVRSGRFIRLTLEAADAEAARRSVSAMCDRLLANPVIETYQVSVAETSSAHGAARADGSAPVGTA